MGVRQHKEIEITVSAEAPRSEKIIDPFHNMDLNVESNTLDQEMSQKQTSADENR